MSLHDQYIKNKKKYEERTGKSYEPKTLHEKYLENVEKLSNNNPRAIANYANNVDYINDFRQRLSSAYEEYQKTFGNQQYNTQDTFNNFLKKYQNQFSDDSYLKYTRALRELQQAGAISNSDHTDLLKSTPYMPNINNSVKNMADYMSRFRGEDDNKRIEEINEELKRYYNISRVSKNYLSNEELEYYQGLEKELSGLKNKPIYEKTGKYALKYSGVNDNDINNRLTEIRNTYKAATDENRQAIQDEYNWLMNNAQGKTGETVRKAWHEDTQARIDDINKELQRFYSTQNKALFTKEEIQHFKDLERERDSLTVAVNNYKRGNTYVVNDEGQQQRAFLYGQDKYNVNREDPLFDTYAKRRTFDTSIVDEQEIRNRLNPENWHTEFDGKTYDQYGNEVTEAYINEWRSKTNAQDKLGVYLASSDEDKTQALSDNTTAYNRILNEGRSKFWHYLKDDEIDMYYYLLNKNGQQAALEFLDDMETELSRRDTEMMTEELREPASVADLERMEELNEKIKALKEKGDNSYAAKQELKALMQEKNQIKGKNFLAQAWDNVESVAGNIYGGILGTVDDMVHHLRGEDINPYSIWHRASNYSQAVRATTAEDFDKLWTDKQGNPIKILGIGLSDAYQSVMSLADMYAGNVLMGGGYGTSMGASAMSSTARDMFEQGASGQDIFWGSLLAGVAEELFEEYSLEKFLSIKDTRTRREWLMNILKQSFTEGSEEFFTEIANNVTDMFVRGTQSNAMQRYYEYRTQGDSEGTATWKALRDIGIDTWKAFVGGAISGGLGGMGRSGSQYLQYKDQMNRRATNAINQGNVQGIYDTAQGKNIDYSLAEQAYNRYVEEQSNKNENKAVKETANVLKQIDETRRNEQISDITTSLIEKGVSERQAKKMAPVISDVLERGYVTEEDDKVFRNNRDIALQVAQEARNGSVANRNFEYEARLEGDKETAEYIKNERIAAAAPKLSFDGTVDGQSSSFTYDHIDGDTLYVKTADGQVVNADDVQTTNRNAIQVMQDSVLFGDDGARAYLNGYEGGSASEYRQTFTNIYNQAKAGANVETLVSEMVAQGVSEKVARLAAYEGQNAYGAIQSNDVEQIRKYIDRTEAQKIEENVKQAAKGQETEIERENRAALKGVKEDLKKAFTSKRVEIRDADIGNLSQEDQGQLAAVTMMLTALGRKVVIMSNTDSLGNTTLMSGMNGGFDRNSNTYYINTNVMEHAYLNIGLHETVHDISKNQPKIFKQIREILEKYCNEYKPEALLDQGAEYDKARNTYSDVTSESELTEIAMEEWVANTVTGIIADPDTFTQFADKFMTESERKTFVSLLDRLLEALKEAFDKIKNVLGWSQIQTVQDDLNLLQQLRDLLFEGYQNIKGETKNKPKTDKKSLKGIRLSTNTQQLDQQYMDIVNAKDMVTAQWIIDGVAARAGFKPSNMFHGSMNATFHVFDKSKANPEGNSGAGFYFTTNREDAEQNYADVEGADNFFKTSALADKIFDDGEWNGIEVEDYDQAKQLAKDLLNKEPGTYKVYLKYDNPYYRDYRNSTDILAKIMDDFDESIVDRDDYDTDEDYEEGLMYARDEHIGEAVNRAVYNAYSDIEDQYEVIDGPFAQDVVSAIMEEIYNDDSLTWNDIKKAIEGLNTELTVTRADSIDTEFASAEFTRAIIENFGYDAIYDKEVSTKFNQLNRNGREADHIIVFHPNQIKLSDPVTYDDNGNVILPSQRFGTGNDIRWSTQSIANAVGMNFTKRGERSVLTDANGNEINKVTREMIINSPLGSLLTQSVRKGILPPNVIRAKKLALDAYDEVDFTVDVMNMILNTQNIEMLYAVSGTLGFDPTNIINETTPLDQIKEKGSRFLHIRSNSENQYGTTVDFTTICVKTQAIIDAMSAVMKERKGGLTKDEVINIVYKEVYKAGEQVPCPVCYVFSRWVGLGGIFDTMRDLQNKFPVSMKTADIRKEFEKVVRKVDKIIADSKESDKELKGTQAREVYHKQVQDRLNELDQIEFYSGIEQLKDKFQFTDELKAERDNLRRELELLDAWSWLKNTRLKDTYKPVPLEILYDINAGKEFAEFYPDSWKFRTTRGAGMGKAAVPYTPAILGNTIMGINTGGKVDVGKNTSKVFTDLEKNPFLKPSNSKNSKSINNRIASAIRKVMAQNLMNGQRLQSTSDFRFEYALDYLLTFLEFSAVGAKTQLYTKVPEAVPFLASTGTECNLSIMPRGTGIVRNRREGDHYIGLDILTGEEIETDQEYSLVFSDVTGMSIVDALAMSRAYDNVQPILVAIGREHLITALANRYITMVIPYHSSGNTLERYQAMMEIVGEAVEDRVDFAPYESEHDVENMTPEQKLSRRIRTKILRGEFLKKGKFIMPTAEEAAALRNNETLRQLLIRFYGKDELGNDAKPNRKYVENFDMNGNDADCYHVFLTDKQASVIMPHEYWDKTSTTDTADEQGAAYVRYCESLGYHPVFAGWDDNGKYHADMDFTSYTGYWKTLIDRCMYNNDGTYHKQQAVRVKDATLDMIQPSVARSKVTKPMQVNDPSKTADIAKRVNAQVTEKRAIEAEQEKQDRANREANIQKKRLEQAGVYVASDSEDLTSGLDLMLSRNTEELDSEYMAAVNAKDMVTAQRMVDEAAKRAMPDSRLIQDGIFHKMWHHTNYAFTSFLPGTSKSSGGLKGIYFTPQEYSSMSNLGVKHGQYYLNVRNPKFAFGISADRKYVDRLREMQDGITDRNEIARINRQFMEETGVDAFFDWQNGWYNVMTPEQIKSADPVVYDDNGNVIPLSKRFNADNNDIRFSSNTEQLDREYMQTVESGNMDKAQRMVDTAAKQAGYDYKGYHGTAAQFNVFDRSRAGQNWYGDSQLGPGFYFAYDKPTAQRWTEGDRVVSAYLKMEHPLDYTKPIPADIEKAIRDNAQDKINGYDTMDNWTNISREQYTENVLRMMEIYLREPDLFIDKYKYDENGKMTDGIREFLESLGYDGIIDKKQMVVFYPEQIKSADPVTYDDNGNVIPLSERFNTDNNDIRFSTNEDEDKIPVAQGISSKDTSIKQVPALFTNKNARFGKTNIDIGGGRYDLATDYLKSLGTTNYVFDPFNRPEETNMDTLQFLMDGNRADTATCANVLNVIAEKDARANVILEMAKAIRQDGTAYFTTYEGDRSGVGKKTKAGYQNNLDTGEYVEEIKQFFENVVRKGKLIIATDPKPNLPKAAWEISPGNAIRFSSNSDMDLSSLDNSDENNLENLKKTIGDQYRLTVGKEMTMPAAEKIARDVTRRVSSKADKAELAAQLKNLFDDAARQGKDLDTDAFMEQGAKIMRGVLEQSATFDSIRYKADEPIRKYLRETGIALNELQQGEAKYLFDSVANYRRALFGSVLIKNSGIPLDVAWQELNKMSSYLFPSDVNDGDMVSYLYDAAKALSKANYYVNEYGFDLDGAAAYEFAQVVGDYTDNKRIKTFVQQLRTYGKRYLENEMKEIRKTRREKMSIQSRLYEEQRKRNVSLKVEISNLNRELSGEVQNIERDITFLQSRLKYAEPGVDELSIREQIADLEQDKANLEARYHEEIRNKTAQLQEGQEELEKIGKEYIKAGSTNTSLALDARKAAIGTKSAVKLRAQKEAQEIRTLQNNIRKKSSNLMSRLISGTDTKHVPENLREAVTGFLQAVDLGWNQGTLAAEKWLSDLNVLADKMAAANEVNGNFQVDDMIISQLREMGARITERLSLAGKNLRTMSIAELNQLDDALSLVNAAIYNSDRLLADDRKQRASAVAERSITEMGKKKQRKHTNDLLGRVGNFFTLDQLDSFSYAERIGGPFKDVIFKNLRKAFDRKVQLVQQGIDAYHKAASVFGSTEKSILSKIRSMSGNNAQTKTFDLESGKKLTLNTAQIMELYLLNERDQARVHLYNGGITVEEYKAKDGTVKKQEFIKVTEDDIDKIIGTLTKEQKQFANELQKYASSNMSEWGNDVSLTLWGVKKFTEQNYWPITVDDNTTDAVSQDKKNGNVGLYHLKNIGMSKAVNPKANNALVLGDVIDTFIRHVDEMTSYAAYTIPLDDAMKWYNYKNGNQTVQRSIESLMGKGGKAWFTDFIRALNSAQDMSGGMDFADTMIRNAKVAAIAANLRVVIQQPSAFARAIEAIDPKYLLNVSNLNVKQGAKEAQEHSSIARWKNWGFRDVNVGGDLRSLMVGDNAILEQVREKASLLAGVADDATWGALWNACKAEIEDKRQDLEKGSEEYWQAISDRFSEVIDRTQVVDSPFHRSKAMRSKNALWKMYTAFMSEPTKTYNMFYKTISNAYQGNWSAETRKAVARATFAFAAATILNSVLAAIVDVGRDTDDEDWWEKYLENMGKNMLDGFNPLNLIPIGKDIVSIFDGYEASRMDLDAVSDLIKQFKRAGATLSGEKDYNTWKILYDSVMALSKITGIPAGNAWRAINSLLNLAGVDVSVFKGTWNNTNAKAVAEDMYSYFAKGDMAGFQRVFDKYVEDEVSKMVEEDTKMLEETGQHKYDSTESMQNKATKAVLNKLAQQLADNEEQIAEAYLAKTIGDGSEVARIRNEYIAKGIPEEVFDKAVNLYGSSMNVQPEGVNELNSKLYSYDDLYAAIESGDLEDIGYIYDEMKEDSQAVNPEKTIADNAVKKFKEQYFEYVASGQTTKANQLENTLEQAFGLTVDDLKDYQAGYLKYTFTQKVPEAENIELKAFPSFISKYNEFCKPANVPEKAYYNVYMFEKESHGEVDSKGKSIPYSKCVKVMAYIDSLNVTAAQKTALALCYYGKSTVDNYKLW